MLNIRYKEQEINAPVSDVYPSLLILTQALHQLLMAQAQAVVTWTCEPDEYDVVFNRELDAITLNMSSFPDSRRSAFVRDSVLFASGRYSEICLPFWRASRGLEGRSTAQELAERWTSIFPHQELKTLTEALDKEPVVDNAAALRVVPPATPNV